MSAKKRIRILLAKPGLDGHERGAQVVAHGLRDEGFEVVYTGLRQRPEEIATVAVQEGVDVVGLSILSGAHLSLTKAVKENLQKMGMSEILILVGGVIPEGDKPRLKELGVAGVFTSGTSIKTIAEFIHSKLS